MARLVVEFSGKASDALDELVEVTTAGNKAEVIRNAMGLFAYVAEHLEDHPREDLALLRGEDLQIDKIILVPGLPSNRTREVLREIEAEKNERANEE